MVNKVGSLDYQKKVLRRLEKQKSISAAEKIAWLSGIYIGQVTSILGLLNIDFVTKEQAGVLNIGNKVHEWQTALLWNIWKKIWWDQVAVAGINIASTVKGWQGIWIWLQYADKAKAQLQLLWGQTAKNITTDQLQWIWIQVATNIWEHQKQIAWLQLGEVWYSQEQKIWWQALHNWDGTFTKWFWINQETYITSEWKVKKA